MFNIARVNKIIILFILIIFLLNNTSTHAQDIKENILDFNQSLNIVLDKSMDYQIAKQGLDVAEKKRTQYFRDLFPSVSLKLFEESKGKINNDYIRKSYGVEISQVIFNGGKFKFNYLRACSEYNAAHEKIKKAESDMVFNTNKFFYNALKFKNIYSDYDRIIKNLCANFKPFEKKYKAGFVAKLDYLETIDTYKELLFKRDDIGKERELAIIELKHELTVPYNKEINIDGVFDLKDKYYDIDKIIHNMLNTNPEIIYIQELLSAAEYGKKAASAEFKPSLFFDGYYNKTDEEEKRGDLDLENDWYAGLKFEVPFGGNTLKTEYSKSEAPGNITNTESKEKESFKVNLNILDSLGDYTKEAEAILDYKKQMKSMDDIKKQYILDAKKAYINFERNKNKFIRMKEKRELYENKVKVALFRINNNETEMLEMIKTYEVLLIAVKDYWESLFEYHMSITQLEILKGNIFIDNTPIKKDVPENKNNSSFEQEFKEVEGLMDKFDKRVQRNKIRIDRLLDILNKRKKEALG